MFFSVFSFSKRVLWIFYGHQNIISFNTMLLEESNVANKKFYIIFFLIGSLVLSIGAVLILRYFYAPTHYYQPEKRGFGVAFNHTRLISPNWYSIEIFVKQDVAELLFYYSFEVVENGSYNFIFVFPFDVIAKIESTEGMNFTKTPYGTAFSLKYEISDVITGKKGDIINGRFQIENTFQSGTKGEYSFTLPLASGIPSCPEIDSLNAEMGVWWHTPAGAVSLIFVVPENLRITQMYPLTNVTGPNTNYSSYYNITTTYVKWDLYWLEQHFTIVCTDSDEKQKYEAILFLSGILISAGVSLLVKTGHDYLKAKLSEKQVSSQGNNINNESTTKEKRASMTQKDKEEPAEKTTKNKIAKYFFNPIWLLIISIAVFLGSYIIAFLVSPSFSIFYYLGNLSYERAKDIVDIIVTTNVGLIAFTGVISTLLLKIILREEKAEKKRHATYANPDPKPVFYFETKKRRIVSFIIMIPLLQISSIFFSIGGILTETYILNLFISLICMFSGLIEFAAMLIYSLEDIEI